MLTIVVSGASGFLGSHLVRHFAREGHQVIALVRAQSSLRRLNDVMDIIQLRSVDAENWEDLLMSAKPIDAVLHTATDYGRNGDSFSRLVETNVVWALRMAEASIRAHATCFINAGTALPPEVSPYARSKSHFSQWQALLADHSETCFIDVALETMYGEDDDPAKFITQVIIACLCNVERLALTTGEQKRDFVCIQDVVAAFARLVEFFTSDQGRQCTSRYMRFAVGSGVAVAVRQVVEMIHRLTASRTMLDFGATPHRPHEVMFSEADLSAMRRLGWSPQYNLEAGLNRTIAWWKTQGKERLRCAG